jgi:hypothetical protein
MAVQRLHLITSAMFSFASMSAVTAKTPARITGRKPRLTTASLASKTPA